MYFYQVISFVNKIKSQKHDTIQKKRNLVVEISNCGSRDNFLHTHNDNRKESVRTTIATTNKNR